MSVSEKRRSVLLLTNSFSTGGAETHILSLAKGLARRGYFVAVASSGGSLEGELEALGVLHIYLPLDARTPARILLSLRLLKEAMEKYRFEILHAHSRLAAFVVSLLPKYLRKNFVTTAHLDFNVTPITRRLSRWGKKTLAVSEDIRAYLVREYGLSYRSIALTVNGIDTERFSKSTAEQAVTAKGAEKIILHISRMDPDRAATAFLLCDILPLLKRRYPVRLILVGGGEWLPRLEKRVTEDALLRESVTVVGEAVDVTPYLAIADCFVGVSRAALEAMACGIPTVLAGNSGYFGIYRLSRLSEAAATNFCCRGEAMLNPSALSRDLAFLLDAGKEELSAISAECRETVEKYYSLERMTNDCEALYASLKTKTKHAKNLILGYHGFGNLGDELLLEKMIEGIRAIDPEGGISVISHSAEQTAREFSVGAVSRNNPVGMLTALMRARVLYVGGGTLLQKETSRRSLYYYVFWITLAKMLGKTVVYYANGLGEFSQKDERFLARLLAGKCVVTLRDRESFALAERLAAKLPQHKKPYLKLTADLALTLTPLSPLEADSLFAAHNLPTKVPYFVLALSGRRRNRRIEQSLVKTALVALEKGYAPIFLLMQPKADEPLAKKLSAAIFSRTHKRLPIVTLPPRGALSLIAGASFLIASRFHALVFGALGKTPLLCLSDSEKCRRFCREVGMNSACLPQDCEGNAILFALPFLLEKHPCYTADRQIVEEMMALSGTAPEQIREGLAYFANKYEKTIERFKIKEGQKP